MSETKPAILEEYERGQVTDRRFIAEPRAGEWKDLQDARAWVSAAVTTLERELDSVGKGITTAARSNDVNGVQALIAQREAIQLTLAAQKVIAGEIDQRFKQVDEGVQHLRERLESVSQGAEGSKGKAFNIYVDLLSARRTLARYEAGDFTGAERQRGRIVNTPIEESFYVGGDFTDEQLLNSARRAVHQVELGLITDASRLSNTVDEGEEIAAMLQRLGVQIVTELPKLDNAVQLELESLRPRVRQRMAEEKAQGDAQLAGLLHRAQVESERASAARAVSDREEYMRLDPRERHVREKEAARQREQAQWK